MLHLLSKTINFLLFKNNLNYILSDCTLAWLNLNLHIIYCCSTNFCDTVSNIIFYQNVTIVAITKTRFWNFCIIDNFVFCIIICIWLIIENILFSCHEFDLFYSINLIFFDGSFFILFRYNQWIQRKVSNSFLLFLSNKNYCHTIIFF